MTIEFFTHSSVLKISTNRLTIHLLTLPSEWYVGLRKIDLCPRFTYYGFGPLGDVVVEEK